MRPRQVRAGVPRTLDAICERVLTKEASQHEMPIETAAEVAAALADYVGAPGLVAPLDATGIHTEPLGPSAPTEPALGLPLDDPAPTPAASPEKPDLDDLESTQLSMAVDQTSQRRAPPPPAFEDLPERPLFAEPQRRVPRHSGSADSVSTPAPVARSEPPSPSEDTGTSPGIGDTGGFWPFVDANDHRNDVHTGTEGRGWLRMGVIAVVLLVLVVGIVLAFNRGRQDGGPTTSGGGPTTGATASATGAGIPVVKATAFDPLGDGSENSADVAKAVDGDPATGWQTSTYYNNPALGGLKSGVGVLLDLGGDRAPASVAVRFKGQPTSVEVYAASSGVTQAPAALDQLNKVGAEPRATTSTTIRLDGTPRTRYLLVWLTRLPPVPGGYRGEITDIAVRS